MKASFSEFIPKQGGNILAKVGIFIRGVYGKGKNNQLLVLIRSQSLVYGGKKDTEGKKKKKLYASESEYAKISYHRELRIAVEPDAAFFGPGPSCG